MFYKPDFFVVTQSEWDAWSQEERAVQITRWLAEIVKVKESGINAGFWVERFLNAVGLGKGYAWCAAALTWAYVLSDCPNLSPDKPLQVRRAIKQYIKDGRLPKNPASVLSWYEWLKATNRICDFKYARRGCVVGWINRKRGKPTGTGHIGLGIRFWTDVIPHYEAFEGNTNETGSREGDGMFRKKRPFTSNSERTSFIGVI